MKPNNQTCCLYIGPLKISHWKSRQKCQCSFPFQAEPKQGSCLSNMTMTQTATLITLPFCENLNKYLGDELLCFKLPYASHSQLVNQHKQTASKTHPMHCDSHCFRPLLKSRQKSQFSGWATKPDSIPKGTYLEPLWVMIWLHHII